MDPFGGQENLYAVLGCPKQVYQGDIRRAFRLWSLRYHPSKNRGDSSADSRFAAVCGAYQVLGDEDKKDQFDRYGFAALSWDGPLRFSDPHQVFRQFFQRYGGWDAVQGFISKQNGNSWEGWDSFWRDLEAAQPGLAAGSGMSCGAVFRPQGAVHPSAGGAPVSRTSSYSAASASVAAAPSWRATPAPTTHAVFGSTADMEEQHDPLGGTAKGRWMSEYRRRNSSSRGSMDGTLGSTVGSMGSTGFMGMSDSYYGGMPSKEAALAEFRSKRGQMSFDSGSDRAEPPRPPARAREGFASTYSDSGMTMKSSWLASFRQKKQSIAGAFA